MPTVAILEDNHAALSDMTLAIEQQAEHKSAFATVSEHSWALVFTASRCDDMNQWLSQHKVDVLICDLALPDGTGLSTIRHCRALHPDTEIMVCTIFDDDVNLFESLRSGANGYLLKNDITDSLIASLQQLQQGGAPMTPRIARRVLQELKPASAVHNISSTVQSPTIDCTGNTADTTHSAPDSVLAALTDIEQDTGILTKREAEILKLVSKGFKYNEISDILKISIHTVNTHLKNTYKKLHAESKSEAVYEARLLHLI